MSELRWRQRATVASADRAEQRIPTGIQDHVAFLLEYGSYHEIEDRLKRLQVIREEMRGYKSNQDDQDAWGGLEIAFERLISLLDTSESIENELEQLGWKFDADKRHFKEIAASDRVGPRRDLVSEWAGDVFDKLTKDWGREPRNTAELREEIRVQLLRVLPPEFLSTKRGSKIYSAVNQRLNSKRH